MKLKSVHLGFCGGAVFPIYVYSAVCVELPKYE